MIALTRSGIGHADAMALRWPEARALADAAARAERARLVATACAMRAAQAPEKAWREWIKATDAEGG